MLFLLHNIFSCENEFFFSLKISPEQEIIPEMKR